MNRLEEHFQSITYATIPAMVIIAVIQFMRGEIDAGYGTLAIVTTVATLYILIYFLFKEE